MNQEQNNYNFQGNNDVSNNQTLLNNQSFQSDNDMSNNQLLLNNQNLNNTFNQSAEQTINNNQQINYSDIQYPQNQFNVGQNSRNNLGNEINGNLIASLVLGILSLALSFTIDILTLPISITGLVLGSTSKTKSNKKIVGIVLNTISIVIVFGIIIIDFLELLEELF